ncbi:MAG: glutathione S-transferase [Gammaproteobacteria bacterium]|nr:MAG: glutathione S-transferase [Gammaproteobacteria bacterium]
MPPVFYSFRRCPYAIRARMALCYAGIQVELREILLKDKPSAMLEASAKGTVPVLVLEDGTVLDESYDVMRWALAKNDPDHWWDKVLAAQTDALVQKNDFEFKPWLDRYKYADRYPEFSLEHYLSRGEEFLQVLEEHLNANEFLLRDSLSFADVAIFPFVRQFALVDKDWFDGADYPLLQRWLEGLLLSDLFLGVMTKYPLWQEGDKPQLFPP